MKRYTKHQKKCKRTPLTVCSHVISSGSTIGLKTTISLFMHMQDSSIFGIYFNDCPLIHLNKWMTVNWWHSVIESLYTLILSRQMKEKRSHLRMIVCVICRHSINWPNNYLESCGMFVFWISQKLISWQSINAFQHLH